MKKILSAAMMALGCPIGAMATDLSGTWLVSGEFGPRFKYALLCILNADGSELSGPCVATQGDILRTKGNLSGTRMRFDYHTDYNGSGVHLKYIGTVQSDGTVKGSAETDTASGQFQAIPVMRDAKDRLTAWNIQAGFPGMNFSLICSFSENGEKLSGPCAATQGPTLQATGMSDGSDVTLGYDTTLQGRSVHVKYAATVQPDGTLSGSIVAGGSQGTFSAKRQ